ncbi:MAG: helix-turn-helix transcriptional regulator [Clostridia bacterium]|nr:helix-turn-helix transcriptional regulator [Clostridia bacterium]
MFINKGADGRNNVCGKQIARFRKESGKSQRELADALQLLGLDIDKNAVQRIEAGKRFVTDIELTYLAKVLGVPYGVLLDG